MHREFKAAMSLMPIRLRTSLEDVQLTSVTVYGSTPRRLISLVGMIGNAEVAQPQSRHQRPS